MVAMGTQYGYRLIWEGSAPGPFESGWSIFAKLLLLNGMKASHIATQISITNQSVLKNFNLNFRYSEWIDFQRFSNALGVEQERLRSAFLDQLGFLVDIDTNGRSRLPGIKICRECLAKGYHCVLFEIGFIDRCPWHQIKLEKACSDCLQFVIQPNVGWKKEGSDAKKSKRDSDNWDTWSSRCGHIHFSNAKTSRSIQFSLLEQKIIAERCKQFLKWSMEVGKSAELSRVLFQYDYHDSDENWLHKHISAAESIAGPCPWPIGHTSSTVRSHIWTQTSSISKSVDDYRAPRQSDWDIVYRSIRRHIFKRYIRQHRICWNEMSSYSRIDALHLDSDTLCPVSLAYAAWRMASERFINIEAFKVGNLRHYPIRIIRLDHLGIEYSLKAHASLLYAQFFYIWEELLRFAGTCDFAIFLKYHFDMNDFAIISNVYHQANEWTVILPDYSRLQRLSFASCCGRLKKAAWMVFPGMASHWLNYEQITSNSDLFRVRLQSFRKRANYFYVSIG